MSIFFAVIVSIGSVDVLVIMISYILSSSRQISLQKQYSVDQFTTYEFNDNRNLHVTECNFKFINSITIYSVSFNSISINSISINSIFNLKKFTSVIVHHCKCLKHSQFDCSFQTITIHFHLYETIDNLQTFVDDRILTQSFSIFYPLLMITFLSMTQLYEFHVKIYHSSRSTDFLCNFLITEYSNKKHHKYQVHYISQSKKDSVIVNTDVTCNCLITKYSNQKHQKYQELYITFHTDHRIFQQSKMISTILYITVEL